MSAGNTPGVWTVSELDARSNVSADYIFIEPGVAVIERKVAGSDQFDLPDAHLLSAAKELLEALQDLVEDHVREMQDFYPDSDPEDGPYVKFARAVIAKATGSAT